MKATDIMARRVISVRPDASVGAIAALMGEHAISAIPVVDPSEHVVGIVSEDDLMRRRETATERRRGWWLRAFAERDTLAAEYVKAHGRKAADVMTRDVVSVSEDTPVSDIVDLLERHRIKRVPVLRDGKLVGIVSRANLVRALAAAPTARDELAADDAAIQAQIAAEIESRRIADTGTTTVMVTEGIVHLWGFFATENEHKAIRIAAAEVPGVRGVIDHLTPRPVVLYHA